MNEICRFDELHRNARSNPASSIVQKTIGGHVKSSIQFYPKSRLLNTLDTNISLRSLAVPVELLLQMGYHILIFR